MKRYRIADLTVEMAVSGRTAQQAAPYACETNHKADICISYDLQDVIRRNPQISSADMAEYLATGAVFARYLLEFDGLYLHSSAVQLGGKAYLFTAPSGTGKSTHTEKWCRLFGASYINDDKPVLRVQEELWTVYGTPWSGKNDLSSPEGVPVGGIAYLKHGDQNEIRRMTPAEALPVIMSQSLWRLGSEKMDRQLALVDRLLACVPVWELTCRNEDAAAILSRDVMTLEVQHRNEK